VIVEGRCGQLPAAERRNYDLVIITPRTVRPDPCAQLQLRR